MRFLDSISLPYIGRPWATPQVGPGDTASTPGVHLETAKYHAALALELVPHAIPCWSAGVVLAEGWNSGDAIDHPITRAAGAATKALAFGVPASAAGVLCAGVMAAVHGGKVGVELGRALETQVSGRREPNARGLLGTNGPLEPAITWQAKETFPIDWFPQQERPLDGPGRNLYGPAGACTLYDLAFGTRSAEYQRRHFYRHPLSVGGDTLWAGFCNNAAAVSSVFEEPGRSVIENGVSFPPEAVKGLLILASNDVTNALSCSDFVGKANKTPLVVSYMGAAAGLLSSEDTDPLPHLFHEVVLKDWGARRNLPFALDIEPRSPVFNYAFDGGRVDQLARPPSGFDPEAVPRGGEVKFYRANITSCGFPEKNRILTYWIHASDAGERQSGWIKSPGSTDIPDFAWLPCRKGEWTGKSSLNPEIDLAVVKRIYERSIGA